jgi:hypothetical protein
VVRHPNLNTTTPATAFWQSPRIFRGALKTSFLGWFRNCSAVEFFARNTPENTYDEGYVPIESLAARVTVRGRGGTVLQPAVNLLESRRDFPKRCPILIITDGEFEFDLTIRHDHAFLLAPGGRLPMSTAKPVFRMS